ncbi:DNA repair protein (mre11), partial [Batrachochytrium salamandrivorans]
MNPPGPDVLRILIATDNHLGFLSSDPIRGEDSFDTLDEILQIGRDRHCDCAFFSGDLFHHNKPSRRVMFRSQQVFKKHVFGPGPVSIQVTSDQEENFGGRIANYEDPTLAVQFPIFMIHGNHDDPCREGPIGESLSAVDMLAESGLVNYFGRADKANDIRIRPVMIEKGKCKVALYGLGWVRDERLHRTFADEKVTF